jgi:glycosyltransferase involved in cell wall biosynthesis
MRGQGRRIPSLRRPAVRRSEGSVVGPDMGAAARTGLSAAGDDLVRRAILEPLFDALQPSSVLVCWIDQTPEADPALPVRNGVVVTSCRPEELARAAESEPDVIWIRGQPNWHTLRALGTDIVDHLATRADGPAVLVVELDPGSGALLERRESAKEGVRCAFAEIAAQVDPNGTLLWCATGQGGGAFLPSTCAARIAPWLAGRRVLLDALQAVHRETVELTGSNFALFELLDQSQRDGTAVVKSLRFRLGTRLLRLARSVLRKEAMFHAPGAILARKAVVESWRARLAVGHGSDESVPAGDALRVTYLLPELRLSGGALVVMQLVSELRSLGVDARIAALKDARREVFRWRLLLRPRVFRSVEDMTKRIENADIVVATHWSSAAWVRELVDGRRAKQAAYFVQDYEAWFYPEADAEKRARVKQSYELIPHKIVTSEWLRSLLQKDGSASEKIPLGLDLGFFYPRPVERPARPVVLAMARPRTPRRGFDAVVAALTKVHDAMPAVDIVLFGEDLGDLTLPFPYRGEGVITDHERLARLYSGARVHFDGSDFQAFGLPALEAMACGTVSVLTDVGGVREYARDEENCLLVPPRDPDAAARAILRLLSDEELHQRLREGGLATSRNYSMRRAARATLDFFEALAASSGDERRPLMVDQPGHR